MEGAVRTMKKFVVVILIASMMIVTAACGKDGGNHTDSGNNSTNTTPSPTTKLVTEPTGEAVSPTDALKPTEEITPTESAQIVSPSPEPTRTPTPTLEPFDEPRFYEDIILMANDPDQSKVKSILVSYQENFNANLVEFDSIGYTQEHRSEWEKAAKTRLDELRTTLDQFKGLIWDETYITEKLEDTIILGDAWRVDVWSHAISRPMYNDNNGSLVCGGMYVVSAWLIRGEKQQYTELYRYCTEDFYDRMDLTWTGNTQVELYYDSIGENVSAKASDWNKILTVLAETEEGPWIYDNEDASLAYDVLLEGKTEIVTDARYFATDKTQASGLRKMFHKKGNTVTTSEWPVVVNGTMTDANGNELYMQNEDNWKIFSYKLSQFEEAFYASSTYQNSIIKGFTDNAADGAFDFDEKCDGDFTYHVEVMPADDFLRLRLTLKYKNAAIRVLDECRIPCRWHYKNDNGDEMTTVFASNKTDEDWRYAKTYCEAFVKLFPKGSASATQEFDSLEYLDKNSKQFETNAKTYEKKLKEDFSKNKSKQRVATAENLLVSIELSDKARFLVYENAAYGEVPEKLGKGTVYYYEVSWYYVVNGSEYASTGILYKYEDVSGKKEKKQYNEMSFYHYFADDMKELFTTSMIGRGKEATIEIWEDAEGKKYEQTMYDEEKYWYMVYTDPNGKLLLDVYDTWGESTDYYISMGAEMKTADGTVLYLEGGDTWKVQGRDMLEWTDKYKTGYFEFFTDPVDLGGGAVFYVSYAGRRDGMYIWLNICIKKNGREVSVKDNRWMG